MKNITYVGFYDVSDGSRVSNLAATKKMDYIINTLEELDYEVNVVSISWPNKSFNRLFQAYETIHIHNQSKVIFPPSIKPINKIIDKLNIIISLTWTTYYLIKNTEKNETVIAYHVEWLALPILVSKFVKKYKLLLEVEEIYSLVWKKKRLFRVMENKLLKLADKYIFVSEKLRDLVDKNAKSTILYGDYRIPLQNESIKKDDAITIVYAGSLDKVKGGAFKALEIIQKLPEKYKLYILGHGTDEEVTLINEIVESINKEKIRCEYLGVKHGQEFNDFMQSCDIAINPQFTGKYMESAFPSKIISYLSLGLTVLSSPVESIVQSSVAPHLFFTESDSAEDFVRSLSDLHPQKDSRKIIGDMHLKFREELSRLIKSETGD